MTREISTASLVYKGLHEDLTYCYHTDHRSPPEIPRSVIMKLSPDGQIPEICCDFTGKLDRFPNFLLSRQF